MKDLNALLRDALRHQKTKVKVVIERPLVKDPVYDLYTNPQNWRIGEPVSLIHRDLSGRETFLGIFVSLHNDRAHARRLVPHHGAVHGKVQQREVVTGDYWLHEQSRCLDIEVSQRERGEIEARFRELISQYE